MMLSELYLHSIELTALQFTAVIWVVSSFNTLHWIIYFTWKFWGNRFLDLFLSKVNLFQFTVYFPKLLDLDCHRCACNVKILHCFNSVGLFIIRPNPCESFPTRVFVSLGNIRADSVALLHLVIFGFAVLFWDTGPHHSLSGKPRSWGSPARSSQDIWCVRREAETVVVRRKNRASAGWDTFN